MCSWPCCQHLHFHWGVTGILTLRGAVPGACTQTLCTGSPHRESGGLSQELVHRHCVRGPHTESLGGWLGTGLLSPFSDVKLIILGSANVGKTCLLQRYLTGDFAETISVSCDFEVSELSGKFRSTE